MHSRDFGDLGSARVDGSVGEFFLASSSSSTSFLLRFSSCIFCSTPISTNNTGKISCDKLSINVACIVVSLARINTILSMSCISYYYFVIFHEGAQLKLTSDKLLFLNSGILKAVLFIEMRICERFISKRDLILRSSIYLPCPAKCS